MTTIIDQLPLPVPSRTDPANFSVRADNFLGELPDFATQINALATELTALGTQVENSKNAAKTSETNAQASAFAAAGSANSAASSSGAALWVSGTTYAAGALVYSPANGRTYRRKTAGAGTTDPSSDSTNWTPILLEISTLYPAIRPSLNLDFVNNRYLDPRISFSRSSTATYYDGKTTHKSEENLLTYSEQLDNAAWTKTNITVTANTQVNPFGQSTSETLTETTANAQHSIRQVMCSSVGVQYTLSFYVKYSTTPFVQLACDGGFDALSYANFNIQTGTIGTVGASAVAAIESVGNSWYRCSIRCTATSTNANAGAYIIMANSSSMGYGGSYTGSTSNSVYIFGAQVEQRSSVGPYQVTTTKPITNYMSSLVSAAVNSPRFDHDPVSRECNGLLIEDSSTNLLTYSEDLSNAVWNKAAVTVDNYSQNTLTPSGSTSYRIVETSATGGHVINRTTSITASGNKKYSYSLYAKAGSRTNIQMIVTGAGLATSSDYANFDLANGVLGTVGAGIDAIITPVGNGWYRCSISFVPISSGTATLYSWIISSPTAVRAESYAGNIYSYLYVWGFQLEDTSASPSSYMPTTSSTVTRGSDISYLISNNFTSWYNQDEGCIFTEFKTQQKPLTSFYNNYVFAVRDITAYNRIHTDVNVNGYLHSAILSSNSSQVDVSSTTTYTMNTLYRVGVSFKQDDVGLSFNSLLQTDTSSNLPKNMSVIYLGSYDGTASLRGHLRRFTYYPKRVSNSELQAMTVV